MNIFLDTSSLIKLYHYEESSTELDQLFTNYPVSALVLSEITKAEFESAIWKKVRMDDLAADQGKEIIAYFQADYSKFHFVLVESELIAFSRELIATYGIKGLRTLDAIQLASALSVKSQLGKVVTADGLLKSFMEKEKLPVL